MVLGITYLIHTVDVISATNPASSTGRTVIAPACTSLPVGTITGHVASITTNAADDACCVVLLLGAVVFAMANLTAVLAGLVFIVAQRSVESSQFSQLVSLKLILGFGSGCGLVWLAVCRIILGV